MVSHSVMGCPLCTLLGYLQGEVTSGGPPCWSSPMDDPRPSTVGPSRKRSRSCGGWMVLGGFPCMVSQCMIWTNGEGFSFVPGYRLKSLGRGSPARMMVMPTIERSGGFGPLAVSGYSHLISLPITPAGARFSEASRTASMETCESLADAYWVDWLTNLRAASSREIALFSTFNSSGILPRTRSVIPPVRMAWLSSRAPMFGSARRKEQSSLWNQSSLMSALASRRSSILGFQRNGSSCKT